MYLAACESRAEESAAPPSNHLVRRHPRGATDRARIKVGTTSRCEGRRLTTRRTLGTVHALTGPCAMNGRVLKKRRLSIDTSGLLDTPLHKKYISSGVCPRNAECGSTVLYSST